MPEKQDKNVVKHGDVTQRVGVEVIRARGIDVEKLIKMLVANAAQNLPAPIITTPFFECILRVTKTTRKYARMHDWRIVRIGS
jgi:hypothetical protein